MILVVFLSLQSWRATLIPIVAVPISLIGTFGVMLVFGFSLNMLTLLGLILAIGIVVDDAIVVVENVDRIMNEGGGFRPYEATKKAMREPERSVDRHVAGAVRRVRPGELPFGHYGAALSPVYHYDRRIGNHLYGRGADAQPRDVRLPVEARQRRPEERFFRYINFGLAKGNKLYGRMIGRALAHSRRMFAAFGVVLIGIWLMNKLVPESFMPQEDQGYFTVELELPEGATIERTRTVTDRAMAFLMQDPDVEYVLNVTGSSPRVGSNQARSQLTVILKSWKERESEDISEVMKRVRDELSRYPESKVYLSTPAVIPGRGTSGGFEMVLEARGDAGYADLQRAVDTLMHYAEQRPEFTGAGLFDASRYSAALFRRGPRQSAVGRGFRCPTSSLR